MITFEEALVKAKKLKPTADSCDEYDSAFVFKCRADRMCIGGDGACVILKEDGSAINQTDFFEQYDAELIREIDI